jgi:hypothetical protein
VSMSMTISRSPALSGSLMTSLSRYAQTGAPRSEQLHVAFFQLECDLELLDTDLDLLTDCLGGSSTCAVEYTAAA